MIPIIEILEQEVIQKAIELVSLGTMLYLVLSGMAKVLKALHTTTVVEIQEDEQE